MSLREECRMQRTGSRFLCKGSTTTPGWFSRQDDLHRKRVAQYINSTDINDGGNAFAQEERAEFDTSGKLETMRVCPSRWSRRWLIGWDGQRMVNHGWCWWTTIDNHLDYHWWWLLMMLLIFMIYSWYNDNVSDDGPEKTRNLEIWETDDWNYADPWFVKKKTIFHFSATAASLITQDWSPSAVAMWSTNGIRSLSLLP